MLSQLWKRRATSVTERRASIFREPLGAEASKKRAATYIGGRTVRVHCVCDTQTHFILTCALRRRIALLSWESCAATASIYHKALPLDYRGKRHRTHIKSNWGMKNSLFDHTKRVFYGEKAPKNKLTDFLFSLQQTSKRWRGAKSTWCHGQSDLQPPLRLHRRED